MDLWQGISNFMVSILRTWEDVKVSLSWKILEFNFQLIINEKNEKESNEFKTYICVLMWIRVMRWFLLASNISRWDVLGGRFYASIQTSCFLFQKIKYVIKLNDQKINIQKWKINRIHWISTLVLQFDVLDCNYPT